VPAYLLPFGNLLVMMKSQSLELHSVKNRFGRRSFEMPGSDGARQSSLGNRAREPDEGHGIGARKRKTRDRSNIVDQG